MKPLKPFRSERINWDLLTNAVNGKMRYERRGLVPYTKKYLYNVWKGWTLNKRAKDVMERLLRDGK